MAEHKTEMNVGSQHSSPIAGFAGSVTDIASDLVELVELQVRLARVDVRAASHRVIGPVSFLLVGLCVLLACLPVIAFGSAAALAEAVGLALWQSQLAVGLSMAVLAVIVMLLSLLKTKAAASQFSHSASEFANNAAWVKMMLRGHDG